MDVKTKRKLKNIFSAFTEKIPVKTFLYPLRFVSAFLLSRGIILGSAAPFGLAASAAFSSGSHALWGLLGTTLGYLSVFDYINSLKYIACVILIFTAHFVFEGTSIYKSRLFSPLAVAIPNICIHLVFLIDGGFTLPDTALAAFETALSAFSAYMFKKLLSEKKKTTTELIPCILTLCAAFTVALCNFSLFGFFSPGRALAFAFVMLVAFCGGAGMGALCGLIMGISVSLAFSSAEFCMLYGICGICCGAFSGKSKLAGVAVSSLSALFISLCLDSTSLLSRGSELLAASGIFLLTSNLFSEKAGQFFALTRGRSDVHFRSYAAKRLNLAAEAFSNLGRVIGEPKRENSDENFSDAALFRRTTATLCKKCTLSKICWQRDFEATRDALNNASLAVRESGILTAKDFPIHFTSRCLHIEKFIASINREIVTRRCSAKFEKKLFESRRLLTKQYSDASAIFTELSSDILANTRFDEQAERELRSHLTSNGILCDSAVYRDRENRLNIHLCGKDLSCIKDDYKTFAPLFEKALGVPLTLPKYTFGNSIDEILIHEKPSLRSVFAASGLNRKGSVLSGDSGSFFSPENGKVALLLSDGMGSGNLAASESAKAVLLLESFIKSCIPPESALKTLQSALTLKVEESGSFATLDLFYANMFTGRAEFYKLGAAPTYVKRGERVRRITSSSLPAGVVIDGNPSIDKTELILNEGDFIIMTSDGVCDSSDEDKLLKFISQSKEASPKALADTIVAFAAGTHGKNDDMTVAVLLIESNFNE
ncbi:MAG: SpoIIE family protein phosphatase [Oscillospiraceae bacterium]|nr:SpoIIE family protein phosphatase [Oscillospiraceae bacterium]